MNLFNPFLPGETLALTYDVLITTLAGAVLYSGKFVVPPGLLSPPLATFLANPYVANVLNAMLSPPDKFLAFHGGKPIGPGALGFPFGIIPCYKYAVNANGISYVVCAYKNVIVYEEYLKDFYSFVALRPALEALHYVPLITDPVNPFVKALLLSVSLVVTALALYAFMKRHEVVVI